MSDSQAALGLGASLSIGDDVSPVVYTEVAELNSIDFDGFTADQVDVTHLKSPNNMAESIPGLLKPGAINFTGNWTGAASQQQFTTYSKNRTRFQWKIDATLGDGSAYQITGLGYVSKLHKGPLDATK